MSKEANLNGLDEQVGDHFSYRHFETGSSHSAEDHQRWKLLESIANQAPGMPRKAPEPFVPATEPTYFSQKVAGKDALHVHDERVESVSSRSHLGALDDARRVSSLSTPPPKSPFDHLFKAYSGSTEEPEHHGKASLKSLLRQINS